MYAVVRSGARSYRVEEGGTITVDRRAGDAGDSVILDQVLLFADGVRVRAGTPFVGIIYVRPGHISAGFVLAVIDALQTSSVEVEPPFVAVAERQESTVRVRVRTAPPW